MNLLKISSKQKLLIAVFVGFTLFLILILHFSKGPTTNDLMPLAANNTGLHKSEKVDSALPARLKIPKIGVNAPINPMGITSSGDMEAPKGPRNVGWYKLGTRPGDIGSAVIDGHYGRWKNGEESVFDGLSKLKKGDNLYTEDQQGVTTTFVVRELRIYSPDEKDTAVFISKDGKTHLNLITCQGIWNETQKSYANRLVVFADKKME